MKPITITNKYIPFKGYSAMLTLFILWIRKEQLHTIDKYTINHETIHMYQQLELLVLALLAGIPVCLFTSLWWVILFILFPLLIYVLCWLIEIILPPYNSAYKNICFESEAIYNECNLAYIKQRKPFAWIKYIKNKKYPYLTHKQRLELWKR